MVRESEIREGELAVEMPAPRDAGLVFDHQNLFGHKYTS